MAESVKHTHGPWICYADLPSTEPGWHIVTTANKLRVLANVHIEPGNATDEANARLIVAAPDMLAALNLAEKHIASVCSETSETDLPDWFAGLASIRAAIAKTEGREDSL